MAIKTICLDFDGVIHKYSKKYDDGSIYDVLMEGALEGIIKLQKDGYKIIISSARPNWDEIKDWLFDQGLPEKNLEKIEITDKKPKAFAYVDDRAIRFINWKDLLNYFI